MKDNNKGKRYVWFVPRFILGWLVSETPKNWITCTPIKFFGIFLGYKMVLAKKGYRWGDGKIQS